MKLTHRSTMIACYNGYITQAISINLAPLFYLIFQRDYDLTLGEISALIAFNFAAQLTIDFFATFLADKMNLRLFTVLAHILVVVGLTGLSFFPLLFPPFAGFSLAVILLGLGGGFTEVLISPLLEACPTTGKSANMSLLHSFYCWGQAGVVLFSGIWFSFLDASLYWHWLPLIWAVIPLLGAVAFCFVPIFTLPREEGSKGGSVKGLFQTPIFWSFLMMMFCAGAGEMIMSQWASTFAESALGVSKNVGDLAGPCMFAVMMGLSRLLYGKFSFRISLRTMMIASGVICTAAYALAAFVPIAWVALLGCALCGLGSGIFWPGTLSIAAERLPTGGIPMFAMLAFAGDIGCLIGPSVAGEISETFGGDLRRGFCFALIFPIVNLALLLLRGKRKKKEK